MLTPLLVITSLAAAQAPVPSASPATRGTAGQETFVPFAGSDGIVGWRADGDRGLFIKALTGGWYYARTAHNCSRLRTAVSIGFVTVGSDDLDRFGSISAEGQRCQLESVTRSSPPPGESDG